MTSKTFIDLSGDYIVTSDFDSHEGEFTGNCLTLTLNEKCSNFKQGQIAYKARG